MNFWKKLQRTAAVLFVALAVGVSVLAWVGADKPAGAPAAATPPGQAPDAGNKSGL